jgi:hypothetical protein
MNGSLTTPLSCLAAVGLGLELWLAGTAPAAEVRGLYGIHDAEPAPTEFLNHIKPVAGGGWVTATVAVGRNPADTSGADFSSLANAGHTVICRLNHGYFPNGTIPLTNDYDAFALRCSNFVTHSTGCSLWVVGNELNLAGEWPFTGSRFAYVSPQEYARCFRKVADAIKAARPNDRVLPAPPAPFAGPFGASTLNGYPADGNPLNWVQYLNQQLTAIAASGPLDGIALHVTSRGYAYADIHSTNKVTAAGQRLYFSFYVYKDWVEHGIPKSLYHLPLYVTECNGYYYWKGGHPENTAKHYEPGWVQEIYAELDRYNQHAIAAGKPVVRCANLYRWCAGCDGWNIDGADNPFKTQILADLDAAVARNFRWPDGTETRSLLVSTGAVWRYLDTGVDPGPLWRGTNFDDRAWAPGAAQLGYGDGDETTVVNGGPSTNRYLTTWFRRAFNVSDPAFFTNLTLRLLRDDGGLVHLNGVEVFRSNMPEGPVTALTPAAAVVDGTNETTYFSTPVSPARLVAGTNLLAVEIHQANPTSSDISFDLELRGLGNFPPAVSVASPAEGAIVPTPTNLVVAASAEDVDGAVQRVELFVGAAKLGEAAGAPYRVVWTNAADGVFALTAVATDSGGKRATSAPVNVRLHAGLVRAGSVWKYLDDGSNQGTAWRGSAFNDSGWPSGRAPLGFGDGDEATLVRSNRADGTRIVTTYFRRGFSLEDRTAFSSLLCRLLRDDGAVVYLNGAEAFRSNMPLPPTNIAHLTLALASVPPEDETTNYHLVSLDAGLLANGTNLLAVEVHQSGTNSSDLSFDLELLGVRAPEPAMLAIEPLAGAVRLSWPVAAQGLRLEASSLLGPAAVWLPVPADLRVVGDSVVAIQWRGGASWFFRLRRD